MRASRFSPYFLGRSILLLLVVRCDVTLTVNSFTFSFTSKSSSSPSPSTVSTSASTRKKNKDKPQPQQTPIISCSSVIEVQRAIEHYIEPGDKVLELGALLTDTSTSLCRSVGTKGNVVLVGAKRKDTSSGRTSRRNTAPFLASTNDKLDDCNCSSESFLDRAEYIELDRFDEWRKCTKGVTFDAMVLDVGAVIGNDLYLSALSIATEFIANQDPAFSRPPRVVIIKSKNLSNLARRLVHSQRLLDTSFAVPDALVRSNEPLVIPCVGVNNYRRTIPFLVKKGDDVIEVGCHFGRTTTLLHDAAVVTTTYDSAEGEEGGKGGDAGGFCVGVDIGPKIIANAKKQYPDVRFKVVDAWNTLDLLKLKAASSGGGFGTLGYDVVYADIGGLSGAHGLFESLALLDALAKALEPRSIVMKSLCMNRLASQLVPFSTIWEKIDDYEQHKETK